MAIDTLFNVNQAAFILKVHPLTIRRYIKEKRLTAVKVGGNVRIKEADLNSFHKNFEPEEKKETKVVKKNVIPVKTFTDADPFLKLKGRAASVEL